MGRTPEGRVKDSVKFLLESYGAWYCMPMGQLYGKRGVPDFVVCHGGRFLAVEAKSAAGRPTPMQNLEMERIAGAGGKAMVVRPDNLGELEEWLAYGSSWKNRLFRRGGDRRGVGPQGQEGQAGGPSDTEDRTV